MNGKTELSLKEKQSSILEIMKDVDRYCRENDIPYSISSGTLLGAVRHGGFIPWDDDADMFMLREDFDRFVASYKSNKYKLLYYTPNSDVFFPMGYAKIKVPGTYISGSVTMHDHGLYLDIFPLDRVPEDKTQREKYMHKVMSTHNRLHHRQKKDIVSIIKSYRHSLDWWVNRIDTLVHTPEYRESPLVAHIVGSHNYRTVIDADRFKTLKDIRFEDYDFLAFSDTDSYLSMVFGPDYMTPKQWAHNHKVYKEQDEQQDQTD